jgi:RTX calcium-binding nonapeptide repeat (4 copies)
VLFGGVGHDRLYGGADHDFFRARDRLWDIVSGGRGEDWGSVDPVDRLSSIEPQR